MTNVLAKLNIEAAKGGFSLHYPSFEIISEPAMESIKQFEVAARTCYRSEDKMTEDISSGTDLLNKIFRLNHTAMVEFFPDLVVKLRVNRGVSHEAVRQRICSFAQECISGDTEIARGLTIGQLWEKTKISAGKSRLSLRRIKSVDAEGNIVKNKILNVLYKGEALVYEVKTQNGYTIKATENHEFLHSDGTYKILKNLKVGSNIMVNGRPSLVPATDNKLRIMYEDQELYPMEIAEKLNTRYRAVVYRLKKMGIFHPRKNDKNPEKYSKNHTQESVEKMRKTIREQYENGRKVWNKGLQEKDHPSVKKQADSLRANHYNVGHLGEKNGAWKGGVSRRIAHKITNKKGSCAVCGTKGVTEAHHKDMNWRNNSPENLIELCINCHNKAHHGWYFGVKIHSDRIISIEPVGTEKVYDLSMEGPNHNYVANGFVVHNSTRYVRYNSLVPYILPAWATAAHLLENPNVIKNQLFLRSCLSSTNIYQEMLANNYSAQEARGALNNNLATYLNMKTNLREWLHIFGLRCDPAAHPDMRVIMCGLVDWLFANNELFHGIIKLHFPTLVRYIDWFRKTYYVDSIEGVHYIVPYVDSATDYDMGNAWASK